MAAKGRGFLAKVGIVPKLSAMLILSLAGYAAAFVASGARDAALGSRLREIRTVRLELRKRGDNALAGVFEAKDAASRVLNASAAGLSGQEAADSLGAAIASASAMISGFSDVSGLVDRERAALAQVAEAFSSFSSAAEALIAASDEGAVDDMLIRSQKIDSSYAYLRTRLVTFSDVETAMIDEGLQSELDEAAGSSLRLALLMGLLFAGLAAITVLVSRSLAKPLGLLEAYARLMAEGDISSPLDLDGRDEMGRIAKAIRASAQGIRSLVVLAQERASLLGDVGSELAANVEETSAAVIEINANLESTRVRLSEQAASVDEAGGSVKGLVSSVDELSAMIAEQGSTLQGSSATIEGLIASLESSAGLARRAVEGARGLVESGGAGRERIEEVTASADSIGRYGESLQEAARVITEIADRTNLLAMNAAIEAAHAGETGKGFSVVAEEIRKLAEQSTSQARDISQDLGLVTGEIGSVRKAALGAVEAFETILEKSAATSDSVSAIADGLIAQASEGQKIHGQLERLSAITQRIESGSSSMEKTNDSVLEQVGKLKAVSDDVVRNNDEIARGSGEISRAIVAIRDLALRNKELVAEVIDASSRFKLGSDDSSK